MSEPNAGEMRRLVLGLALPALGEQLLNFCVALYDTFLAGYVSTDGREVGLYTTTVGIASYLSWLASLVFALVGTSTTALVARAHGAGDQPQANRLLNCSLWLVAPLGLAVFAFLVTVVPSVAAGAGLTGESADVLVRYVRWDAVGQLLFGFCLVGSAALRGVGDMRTPMYVLGGVNLLNIGVATLLVRGTQPNSPLAPLASIVGEIAPWGVNGIVAATVAARLAGGVAMLALLARGIDGLKWRPLQLLPQRDDFRRLMRVGLPTVFEGASMWLGQWLFLMIIARLGTASDGSAYKAAHMIGMDAEALTYLPATAWGYAAAALVGQSLGAQQPDRARRLAHEATRHAVVLALIGAVAYLLGAELIYHWMTKEEPVRRIGAPALRFLSWYQVPLAVTIVYMHVMRGAGATRIVMLITTLGLFGIRLPVAWLLGNVFQGGLIGAWSGMCVDVVVRCLIFTLYFRRGEWTRTRV